MEPDPKTIANNFVKFIPKFEKDLGLRSGFLTNLRNEDDWSFIIKAHALIEAAVSTMLTRALDQKLKSVIEHIGLGNTKTGKLAFVKALQLLDNKHINYIKKLSELRNKVVHDVRKVDFSFFKYVKSLDESQKSALFNSVFFSHSKNANKRWSQNAIKDLKFNMWMSTIIVVGATTIKGDLNSAEKELMKTIYNYFDLLQETRTNNSVNDDE